MVNLVGLRFNSLVVLNYEGHWHWRCRCDCGAETVVRTDHLRKGGAKSCGCLRRVHSGLFTAKHGQAGEHTMTPEYKCWVSLRWRCRNPNEKSYARYGGRGIRVCDRWEGDDGFIHFWQDMGPRPGKDYSLDRIDNDGNYEPTNCRWATKKQQAQNRRPKPRICSRCKGPRDLWYGSYCRRCHAEYNRQWMHRTHQ